jgi:TatD DNase family protein
LSGAEIARTPATRVGEIGLTITITAAGRSAGVFRACVRRPRTGLPVVIHTRAADDDTLATLREDGGGRARVFHRFSLARRPPRRRARSWPPYLLAGIVTFPKAVELRRRRRPSRSTVF